MGAINFGTLTSNHKLAIVNEPETQEEEILNHLIHFGSITSWEAITEYGATRLSAIIYNLKNKGYNIKTTSLTVKTRYGRNTTIAKYTLHK